MKKIVAVLGPAQCLPGERLYDNAERLGHALAEAGFTIVTGGYDGVMEAASKGASVAGGVVIGVSAEVYYAKGREPNSFLTREIRVKSASDRLMELLDLPDAWCAIGNSTGTLAEVAMAWDYMVKGFIERKPLLLIGQSWREFELYVKSEAQFPRWLDRVECCATVESAVHRIITIFGEQPRIPELEVINE